MTSLTHTVQQTLQSHIQPGDTVIDATAGNGRDTLFLAEQVGCQGKVYAFDIQAAAIEITRSRLVENNMLEPVTLLHCSHALLMEKLPMIALNTVSTIMFNLGYLPGSDKTIITRPHSTLQALDASLKFLKPNGWLSIVLYPGHSGGDTEADAVMDWARALPDPWILHVKETPGPIALMIAGAE